MPCGHRWTPRSKNSLLEWLVEDVSNRLLTYAQPVSHVVPQTMIWYASWDILACSELVYDLFHEDKNYPQYYCTIKSMLTFPNKVPTHSVVCQYTSAHLVDSRLCIYIYRYKVTSTLMGLLKNLTLWVHLKARFPEFPNAPRPSYFL